MKGILIAIFVLFLFKGHSQTIPQMSEIPIFLDDSRKQKLNIEKEYIISLKDVLKTHIATFNTKCKAVPEWDTQLIQECEKEQLKIKKEKKDLIDTINGFNADVINASNDFFAEKEEKKITDDFDFWMSEQHTLTQSAVKADSNWTNQFKNYLKGFGLPDSSLQPRGVNDLKNGDVLLLFPITLKDKLTDLGDKFYNSYSIKEDLKACHALVFIGRDPGGKALFLNNTAKSYLHPRESPGGPHIISQAQFEKEYGNYDYYVARPREVVDGKKLFLTAQEMHINASKKISLLGSSYGVLGNDIVCSESSDIVVARATGRQPVAKGKFIDITPNNFFDKQDVGRYYIISPLVKKKETK